MAAAVEVVERHQTARKHRRTGDLILAGKRRPGADRPGPGVESACIVADHAAAVLLADLRRARRELAGDARRVTVADAAIERSYTPENCPPVLPDGATLKV